MNKPDDPIFAVIERHREVVRAEAQAWRERAVDDSEPPPTNAIWEQATIALLSTRPTTVAGAAAVLEYVGTEPEDGRPEYSIFSGALNYMTFEESAEDFLPMIAQVLRDISEKAGTA